jgi:hypothetical protein
MSSVYFITVSITTVGYGFFTPTVPATRIFMIFYLIIGVSMIINFVSDLARNLLVSTHDEIIFRFYRWRQLPKPTEKEMSRLRVVLSVILVLLWCLVGTLFYGNNEGWTAIDALYWTVCTMTTVGYGKIYVICFI